MVSINSTQGRKHPFLSRLSTIATALPVAYNFLIFKEQTNYTIKLLNRQDIFRICCFCTTHKKKPLVLSYLRVFEFVGDYSIQSSHPSLTLTLVPIKPQLSLEERYSGCQGVETAAESFIDTGKCFFIIVEYICFLLCCQEVFRHIFKKFL